MTFFMLAYRTAVRLHGGKVTFVVYLPAASQGAFASAQDARRFFIESCEPDLRGISDDAIARWFHDQEMTRVMEMRGV